MGTELLIGLVLAFIVLGPERMHSMLGHVGRAKAQFDKASQQVKDQLAGHLEDGACSRAVLPLTTSIPRPMHRADKADEPEGAPS
jgi:Sec-independent protein translocase protein TatA